MQAMAVPTPLEEKYGLAALALADLSEAADPIMTYFIRGGGVEQLWQAGRYTLIALRRRKSQSVMQLQRPQRQKHLVSFSYSFPTH